MLKKSGNPGTVFITLPVNTPSLKVCLTFFPTKNGGGDLFGCVLSSKVAASSISFRTFAVNCSIDRGLPLDDALNIT